MDRLHLTRRPWIRIVVAATAVAALGFSGWRYAASMRAAEDRSAVMTEALTLVERKAVGLDTRLWPSIRRPAEAAAANAGSQADLYAAIRRLLASLDDGGHSFVFTPDQWKRVKVSTVEDAVEHQRKRIEHVRLVDLPGNSGTPIALVDVPSYAGMEDGTGLALTKGLAGELHNAAAAQPCAVVVDLRRTGGGNMWPSLTALRALVDPDHMGGIVDRDNRPVESYRVLARESFSADLGERALPLGALAQTPLAILIGPGTTSASEAIAAFLRARPGSVLIGQPSAGMTTTNEKFDLPDGGVVILSTGRLTDPSGRGYRAAIQPDLLADRTGGMDSVARALGWAANRTACKK